MKKFFTLILIALVAIGCGTYNIPRELEKEQQEFQDTPEGRNGGPDIVLPPIEQTPVYPSRNALQSGTWAYDHIGVDRWSETIEEKATREVIVRIFDTSGDYEDSNLKPVTIPGESYTGESKLGWNGHSHHVAGTYVGATEGSRRIGIAEPLRKAGKIKVQPDKVLTNSGTGSYSYILNAGRAALPVDEARVKAGKFVIWNFSLGGGSTSSSLEKLFKDAENAGILVVAASGNTGRVGVNYPGSSEYTIAVGATDQRDRLAYFSTKGPEVFVAAPGVGIYSILPGGNRGELNGTSMATPLVGAVCAIVASVNPFATAKEIKDHVAKYAVDMGEKGKDESFGYGIPKLDDLLKYPVESDDPGEPAPPEDEPHPDPSPTPINERTHSFRIDDTFPVYWNTRQRIIDRQPMVVTNIRIRVKYTHRSVLSKAAEDVKNHSVKHFRGRGYTLPDGSDEYDAAYWAGFFFDLINKRDGFEAKIEHAEIEVNGTIMDLCDFENRPSTKKATKENALTFKFGQPDKLGGLSEYFSQPVNGFGAPFIDGQPWIVLSEGKKLDTIIIPQTGRN